MQRSGIAGVLLRRWYLFVPGLLVTAEFCAAAAVVVPPTYVASGYVVLLPPQSAQLGTGGNPYLALGGLDSAVSILSLDMNDSNTTNGLRAAGATGTHVVAGDQAIAGPVVIATANNATAAGALQTLNLVMKQIPVTLNSLQASIGAQRADFIGSSVVAQDRQAKKVYKSLIRAVLAAGVLGLGLVIVSIAVIDGFLLRRRERRRLRAMTAASGDEVAERDTKAANADTTSATDDASDIQDEDDHADIEELIRPDGKWTADRRTKQRTGDSSVRGSSRR